MVNVGCTDVQIHVVDNATKSANADDGVGGTLVDGEAVGVVGTLGDGEVDVWGTLVDGKAVVVDSARELEVIG